MHPVAEHETGRLCQPLLQTSSDMPPLQNLQKKLERYDKPRLEARSMFWKFPG